MIVISYLYQWLGDVEVLHRYLRNAEAAMAWIDTYGDRDGDEFQEYRTRSSHGYYNQGWKDAGDAILQADGSIAELPIGVCELQGYAYDAKLRLGDIYETLDRLDDAERLRAEARRLYERFNNDFWWENEGTYYLGLDGQKRPIEVLGGFERRALPRQRHRPGGSRRPRRRTVDGRRHVVGVGRSGRCPRTTSRTTRSAITPGPSGRTTTP